MDSEVLIPAIKMKQPIGDFFVGAISPIDLCHIADADVRRLEENEMDRYIGIQRRLDPKRVNDIKNYVEKADATFPTGVILAVPRGNVEFDPKSRTLRIFATEDRGLASIASIIDGQHRVAGLQKLSKDIQFDVPVSVFVGASTPTQANIFATVNLAQTKVNKSLVYDLLDYESYRSPEKIAHDVAITLDRHVASPMKGRIKRLGFAERGADDEGTKWEIVTQAVIVESLAPLLAPSDARRKGILSVFSQKTTLIDIEKHPFIELYRSERDIDLGQCIMNYFRAVEGRWPQAWNDLKRKGNVLPKTNGIKALFRFLRLAHPIATKGNPNSIAEVEQYRALFDNVDLTDDQFSIATFPPGTSGEAKLFGLLKDSISVDKQLKIDF